MWFFKIMCFGGVLSERLRNFPFIKTNFKINSTKYNTVETTSNSIFWLQKLNFVNFPHLQFILSSSVNWPFLVVKGIKFWYFKSVLLGCEVDDIVFLLKSVPYQSELLYFNFEKFLFQNSCLTKAESANYG